MKPNLIKKEINDLEVKLKDKIKFIGVANVSKITGVFPTNLHKYLRGDMDYSYKRILEWSDMFDIQ